MTIKIVKYTLLLAGIILIAYSSQLNYTSQFRFREEENWESIYTHYVKGWQHAAWRFWIIITVICFSIGFFYSSVGTKIAFYIALGIFSLLGLAFSALSLNTWGGSPFILTLESSLKVELLGFACIMGSTIVSLHTKKRKSSSDKVINLLDSQD